MDAGVSQVEFIAVNTDIQQLQMSDAQAKIHIGRELTQGLGSGADPAIGRRAKRISEARERAKARCPHRPSSVGCRPAGPGSAHGWPGAHTVAAGSH